MKIRRRSTLITALLVGAVAIVVLNGVLSLRSLRELDTSQHWVEHTWQAMNQVELIMGSVKDAETGGRGFLITNDDAYLEPYDVARRELPPELDKFALLTQDNPVQVRNAATMRASVDERLRLIQDRIDRRRAGGADPKHVLGISGAGKTQMDALRHLADQMKGEEQRLLVDRTRGERVSAWRARVTFFLASALDLLLILFTFRYFNRERALRFQSQETAASLAMARAEVERNAEEVRQLNVTLEERVRQRTAELEATNRELEAFSYSVSHDLRSPLRTIDGFSLALEEDYRDAVDATGRDYIQRVRTGVQRMGQLIDALLQLSRITRAEISREKVDLSALVHSVADDLSDEYPGRNLGITIEPGMTVNGDPKLLRVALENLLNNAAKFSSKVEQPAIQVGFDSGQSAYFVKDNGAGFDMYYASKLFNAFNRLHGDRDFKGSGIGLATVARVIHRHHGRIWADAAVDHGATFFFTVG